MSLKLTKKLNSLLLSCTVSSGGVWVNCVRNFIKAVKLALWYKRWSWNNKKCGCEVCAIAASLRDTRPRRGVDGGSNAFTFHTPVVTLRDICTSADMIKSWAVYANKDWALFCGNTYPHNTSELRPSPWEALTINLYSLRSCRQLYLLSFYICETYTGNKGCILAYIICECFKRYEESYIFNNVSNRTQRAGKLILYVWISR